MHIPDGLLEPRTCIGTAAIAALAVGYSLRRVKRDLPDRTVPLMGVIAACVFAAQMINFPIPGGTSGHLLGGVLAAVMVGPWAGLLVMTMVLVVQCLLFQDGGVTALGANVLNVGVVNALLGFAIYASVRRLVGGLAGILTGAVVAAWLTVLVGAILCALEISLGGNYPLGPTVGAMLLVHSVIGLGESLVTGLALSFILRTRPDLIYDPDRKQPAIARLGQVVAAGLGIAIVTATLLSPWASSLPDGLTRVVEQLGFDGQAADPVAPALLAGYEVPGLNGLAVAGSIAGALGTIIVFIATWLVARRWPVGASPEHISHAR